MNWSGFSSFLNPFLSFITVVIVLATAQPGKAQQRSALLPEYSAPPVSYFDKTLGIDSTKTRSQIPDPMSVLYKSLIIPGWGQVVNRQIWKVPIIYGLLAGLTGYSIYLTKKYHDYRAAYYNLNPDTPNQDQRFGPTPAYIPKNANISELRSNRNNFRNQRDFIYITIALAYGLNVIDAYVFAHLRSFDVSDDLSMRATVKPHLMVQTAPGITLSVELFKK